MSPEPPACERCLRRSGALSHLSVRIDHSARDPEAVQRTLALDSETLIQALGGRRRSELRALCADIPAAGDGNACTCRHAAGAPQALCAIPGAPTALWSAGRRRLHDALSEPVVAILGTRRPSDYGVEIAGALGRGLAAAGITVAAPFQEGIAGAAIAGALSGGGGALACSSGGLGIDSPACLSALRRRLLQRGCLLSQLPEGTPPRRWSRLAAQAISAALACVVVVVEAREDFELAAARVAVPGCATLAAVPGRVTSPCARGPNSLLRQGASLVAAPEDVLDLIHGHVGAPFLAGQPNGDEGGAHGHGPSHAQLDPVQQRVLDRIGDGQCTLESLLSGPGAAGTLVALSELEALRLLARDQAGRYLPRLAPSHQIRLP